VRTAAFIHSPLLDQTLRGTTYDSPFHMVDWLPTILQGIVGVGEITPGSSVVHNGLNQWDALTKVVDHPPRQSYLYNLEDYGDFGFRGAVGYGSMKLLVGEKEEGWFDGTEVVDDNMCREDAFGLTTQKVLVFNVTADQEEALDLYDTVSDNTLDEMWRLMDFYWDSQAQIIEQAPENTTKLNTCLEDLFANNEYFLVPWSNDCHVI